MVEERFGYGRRTKMKTRKRNMKLGKKGLVLPVIAAIALCLALLGLGLLQLSYGGRIMSGSVMSETSAREAADAGLARALYSMNVAFYNNQNNPAVPVGAHGPETLENTLGSNVSYNYTIEPAPNPVNVGAFLISSTGTAGRQNELGQRTQRTVYALTRMSSQFDYALFVTNDITMNNTSKVDGYNSLLGPYGGSNQNLPIQIGSNTTEDRQGAGDEGIFLHDGVEVVGDVAVGPGAEPDVVIDGIEGVTGNTYSMGDAYSWSPIVIPDGPTIPSISFNHATQPIGTAGIETIYETSNVNIGQDGILEVYGHVRLHVTGTVNVGNSAVVIIKPDSSLWMYIDGTFDSGQSALFTQEIPVPRPGNLILYGTGPIDDPVVWTVRNDGDFYGVIYAPNVDLVMDAKGEIFGAIAARSCDLKNSSMLHYDMTLANPALFPAGYVIERWWERMEPVAPTP
jgi:Tfp pilus assembly protein PilX